MKLAILCGGKPQLDENPPLEGIDNSLNAIGSILSNNGWNVISFFNATTEFNFQTVISNYIEENSIDINKIESVMFVYTGHGMYGDSYSQDDFTMVWYEQKVTISRTISLLNETLKTLENKTKLGLIIDACYSGSAITERDRDKGIEILTSTQEDQQTFEKEFDGKVMSIFSYTFNKIFELPNQKEELTFREIKKYINNPDNHIDELDIYYNGEPLEGEPIVIGNNKELNDIRDKIINYYNDNISYFRENILSYLPIDSISFKKIVNCNNFNKLINYLFDEQECLYCILKNIDPSHNYLHKLKEIDCENRKNEDGLKKIVFIIGNSDSKDEDSKKYEVKSFLVTKKNRLRPVDYKIGVDFSKKCIYEKDICEMIKEIDKQLVSDEAVEINFILPTELHNRDFLMLKCNEQELKYEYDILTQSYIRYLHVDKDNIHKYIARWKANSTKILANKEKRINEHLFPINNHSACNNFGKRYIRNGSNYVCLVSSITLVSYVDTIIDFGVPIVVFPWDNESGTFSSTLEIGKIKYCLLDYISDNGDNHYFMYDIYEEVKELKKQITQNSTDVKEYL